MRHATHVPSSGPSGREASSGKLGTAVPSRRADVRTGVLRSPGYWQVPRHDPPRHGNCGAQGGNEGTAVPIGHRMKAESTILTGRRGAGHEGARKRPSGSAPAAKPVREDKRAAPGPFPPRISRTGFGAGAGFTTDAPAPS